MALPGRPDLIEAFSMITAAMRDASEQDGLPSITISESTLPQDSDRWSLFIVRHREHIRVFAPSLSEVVIDAALELQRQDGDL